MLCLTLSLELPDPMGQGVRASGEVSFYIALPFPVGLFPSHMEAIFLRLFFGVSIIVHTYSSLFPELPGLHASGIIILRVKT